ncbi:cwfJ domain-containing protein, partial [Aspergillus sp. HF37]
KQRGAPGPPPGPDNCFFCLSNPNIATHLITSIGNECYLTTARGPLPTSTSFPSLGFPSHILIIPFTHTPALNIISEASSRQPIYAEMQRYRAALHAMLAAKADNALGAVTWEISRSNGVHIHWQFLPASAEMVEAGLVEAAFKVEAENSQYPKFEAPAAPQDPSAEPGDYFRVRIWRPGPAAPEAAAAGAEKKEDADAGKETTLVLPLTPDFRFDLQFGRRVMAKLMQLDSRVNWKDAVQGPAEEEKEAGAFKEAFKRFDFSLEE